MLEVENRSGLLIYDHTLVLVLVDNQFVAVHEIDQFQDQVANDEDSKTISEYFFFQRFHRCSLVSHGL